LPFLQASTTSEFLGLTADYWQAIATFVAPIVAGSLLAILGVRLAGRRLRRELQGQDARRYFLEEGLHKLSDAFQQMLGATRLNYSLCGHLLGLLRNYDQDHLVAPRPGDLPSLTPAITDATVFAAIGPASRIADFTDLGDLATKAFARILNINLWFLTEIWLPIRGYYSKESPGAFLDRTKASDELIRRANAKFLEAEEFRELPRVLGDMALRAREIGFNSFDDFWRVRKDREIIRLRNELKALLDRLGAPASPPGAD